MKIAFLSFYSGVIERGVEVWVKELSQRLIVNHQVTIYQAGKAYKNYEKQIPIEVDWTVTDYSFSIQRRFYLDYWSRKICEFTQKTLREIKASEFDIVIPTNGGWQSKLLKFFAWKNNKKLVIVGHSGMGWDDRVNMLLRPDVFIVLSEEQRKWAYRNGFGVNVEKIPDGVDLKKFTPLGEQISLQLPKPLILVVSNLSNQKRVDLAIKAVSRLEKGSLIVLGSGDMEQTKKINKLGKSLLAKRFLLTSVSHDEIPKWYRTVDLVTFPSFISEAFGMVLLEALSCNKPVVVTDDLIRREIVGKGGLFCDPQDTKKYANTLSKALKTNFGDKPQIQAEKFSWDNIVAQYEKLFRSL